MNIADILDNVVNDRRFLPYHGWHDDHRGKDRTPEYMPAVQQNRSEFLEFVEILDNNHINSNCLQLGLGIPGASHYVFEKLFKNITTVEIDLSTVKRYLGRLPNHNDTIVLGDTHNLDVREQIAQLCAPSDLLFIDAGHTYDDVSLDFYLYAPLVRKGGIIAFHDALKRPTYETEIEVWKFLYDLKATGNDVRMIGTELGIAWMIKK